MSQVPERADVFVPDENRCEDGLLARERQASLRSDIGRLEALKEHVDFVEFRYV